MHGVNNKKVLVLGRGKSGEASATLLRSQGYEVDFADNYEFVIASPGLLVKSELQVGCEELRRRGIKLLGVTGSKGKSSVVKIVAEAVNGVACGNYGLPVCEVKDTEWAVVEVSSFQLETTNLPPDTFEATAVLNFQEDHLDRHGSVEVYHGLKRKLYSMTRNPLCAVEELSCYANLLAGSYFDNDILRENGLYAIGLMKAAGVNDERIAKAFREFKPLPHRMNEVAVCNGVKYIDDSKATSIAALGAGVVMAGHSVRLIAGGLPKGDDPEIVCSILTERVKKVYLIGQSAEAFFKAWHKVVECELCGTMERAVERARLEAQSGDKVLLSPGTASFDQFKSFGERGEVFTNLVNKEGICK